MVFLVVMYGCESWTIKKAEGRRIDGFKLWCWRRLLAIPWTARRSNQSILKEINPEYSLEGLMLKLKLQYSGHMMWRADSLEKTLMLGKIEGRRRRGRQRMRWLDVAYLKHCSPTGAFPPGKPNDLRQYSAGPNVTWALRTTVKNCRGKRSFIPPNELVITHAMLGEVREDYA